MPRKRSVEYVGKKFGKLSVVSEVEKRNAKRMFLCKCDCGNESIVRGTHLTSGRVQSCGFPTKEEAIAARQAGEEKYYLPQLEIRNG